MASKAGYAHDIEVHGGQTHEAALAKAEADFPAVLPLGLETPGHASSWSRLRVSGWPPLAGRAGLGRRRVLFIYDMTIDPEHQGRGYGRAAMGPTEEEARGRGIGRIELNVFGGNDVARGLYRSLGYVETSAQMAKDLG